MNTFGKMCTSLAALALVAVGLAQHSPPEPMPVPTFMIQKVEPIAMQPVAMIGNHVVATGKRVPYLQKGFQMRRQGNLIFDAFEGNGMSPDAPTDGLYGEDFFPAAHGSRWWLGDTWVNTRFARRFEQVNPGEAGITAKGFDFTMANNSTGDTVKEVLVFTSDDPFDPTAPMAPTNFHAGVKLTYAGIAPGSFIFSNVDLTMVPLTMPAAGKGWFEMIIASGDDAMGNPIQAKAAQPMLWGTKPHNHSVVSKWEYQDGPGDGTGRINTLNTLFDWTYGFFGTATDYSASRGVETSTHAITNIQGNAGAAAVIQQRLQSSLNNNCELTATVTLDPNTPATANLLLLRAIVRCKSNVTPLNDPTASLNVSMLNNVTNGFDIVEDRLPTNPSGDGDLVICPSIPVAKIANYINATTKTVQIRVGVRHLQALSINWGISVNLVTVDASAVGPDPLAPAVAFSSP